MEAYTYIKYDGMKSFKACNINDGVCIDRLIYATLVESNEINNLLKAYRHERKV